MSRDELLKAMRWNFSREEEGELAKFMKAVRKKASLDFSTESQSNTENAVVDLTDDDASEDERQNLPFENAFFSQMEATQPTQRDTCDYIQECIGSDYGENSEEVMQKLGDLDRKQSKKIFTKIAQTFNGKELERLGSVICTSDREEKLTIAELFCRHVLLQKISNEQKDMEDTFLRFVQNFPLLALEELIIPLFISGNSPNVIAKSIKAIGANHYNTILGAFVQNCTELQIAHLAVLQCFVSQQISDSGLKVQVVNLLKDASESFSKENSFAKLVVSFLKNYGDGLTDVEDLFSLIIACNKTLLKNQMRRALEDKLDG